MKKIFFSTIFCLLMCSQAYGQTWNIGYLNAEDVTATLNVESGTLTISGTGMLYVPQTPPWDSYASQITHVVIQEGITEIGPRSFGNYPGYSSLTSIEIPESVTKISESTFDGTLWYKSQPDGLVYIGKWLYEYKGTIPKGITINILEGTIGIAESALFSNNSISVIIPESVTKIGDYVIQNCNAIINISPIPISISLFAFYHVNKNTCRLYVPAGSKEAYQNPTYGWQDFNIIELPQISENDINFTSLENSAQVEWQPVENAEGYRLIIFRDETHTDTVCVLEFDATGTLIPRAKSQSTNISHTINDLSSGTYYYTFEILGVGNAVLTGLSSTFEVKETTGIAETQCIASLPVGYYNLLGAKLPQEPTSGIYIIKYDNGKTEKVVR